MYIPTYPTPSKRVTDFEKMGFGMFVHYGLYSQLEKGEWIYWMTDRNMEKYKELAKTFTAEDFDAEDIVLTAKNAGCKYVNLTTRHHEGFSLYDTCGLNDFDSVHSPCKRDLVYEFVNACAKHNMTPILYHTTLDWYQKSFEEDFDSYLEYLRQSVEILCKNYGKIGGLWFDGNWIKPHADWKLDDLYGTIRKYQPDAIITNNTGLHNLGNAIHPEIDCVTFEQSIATPIDRDGAKAYFAGESCMTLNTHWGYARNDYNYKSPEDLIKALARCRTNGCNFLVNISPTGTGKVLDYQKGLLSLMGQWTETYKEALYDIEPLYYPNDPRSNTNNAIIKSRDGKSLYIFVFDLGKIGDRNVTVDGKYSGVIAFANVQNKIDKIEWLDSKQELEFNQTDDDTLCVKFTGYDYGFDYCVRVAKAYLK